MNAMEPNWQLARKKRSSRKAGPDPQRDPGLLRRPRFPGGGNSPPHPRQRSGVLYRRSGGRRMVSPHLSRAVHEAAARGRIPAALPALPGLAAGGTGGQAPSRVHPARMVPGRGGLPRPDGRLRGAGERPLSRREPLPRRGDGEPVNALGASDGGRGLLSLRLGRLGGGSRHGPFRRGRLLRGRASPGTHAADLSHRVPRRAGRSGPQKARQSRRRRALRALHPRPGAR